MRDYAFLGMTPRLVFGLVAAMLPHAAHATGVCENTGTTYGAPNLFGEATETFAIPATLAWCEEQVDDTGLHEVRGTIAFTELRDVKGNMTGALSAAKGKDAKQLEAKVGAFQKVPAAKLAVTLTALGFAPIIPQSTSKTACRVHASWRPAPNEDINGFPSERLFVDIRAGKQSVYRDDVGLAAVQRHGKEIVLAHFYATKQAVAVFTLLPTCEGPLPGSFGPDDGGSCYDVDVVETTRLDASKGALARCFARD